MNDQTINYSLEVKYRNLWAGYEYLDTESFWAQYELFFDESKQLGEETMTVKTEPHFTDLSTIKDRKKYIPKTSSILITLGKVFIPLLHLLPFLGQAWRMEFVKFPLAMSLYIICCLTGLGYVILYILPKVSTFIITPTHLAVRQTFYGLQSSFAWHTISEINLVKYTDTESNTSDNPRTFFKLELTFKGDGRLDFPYTLSKQNHISFFYQLSNKVDKVEKAAYS